MTADPPADTTTDLRKKLRKLHADLKTVESWAEQWAIQNDDLRQRNAQLERVIWAMNNQNELHLK